MTITPTFEIEVDGVTHKVTVNMLAINLVDRLTGINLIGGNEKAWDSPRAAWRR